MSKAFMLMFIIFAFTACHKPEKTENSDDAATWIEQNIINTKREIKFYESSGTKGISQILDWGSKELPVGTPCFVHRMRGEIESYRTNPMSTSSHWWAMCAVAKTSGNAQEEPETSDSP